MLFRVIKLTELDCLTNAKNNKLVYGTAGSETSILCIY
jgi:hypothetical protein